MKKVVDSGRLGHPLIWRYSNAHLHRIPWYRDVDAGAGPLMDGGVYNYDFALQIFGPVSTVMASTNQLANDSTGDDGGSAILTFASGHQKTLIWTWGGPRGSACSSINDIIGHNGWLHFDAEPTAKGADSFNPGTHGALTVCVNGNRRLVTYPLRDMFLDQAKHVVGRFARNEQPSVTSADGIAALRIALAVLKSGRSRRATHP